jgi:serine/threonine protein kinase
MFKKHLCLVYDVLGPSIYDLLKQGRFKGFSLPLVRHFVTQVLHCLVSLRRARVIHCDLKPENILLTK